MTKLKDLIEENFYNHEEPWKKSYNLPDRDPVVKELKGMGFKCQGIEYNTNPPTFKFMMYPKNSEDYFRFVLWQQNSFLMYFMYRWEGVPKSMKGEFKTHFKERFVDMKKGISTIKKSLTAK